MPIDENNLFDNFFQYDAFFRMKEEQALAEAERAEDKPAWYRLFHLLTTETIRDLYFNHYYYTQIYIPNAQSVQDRLQSDYETSEFGIMLERIGANSEMPKLNRVVEELIDSGYLTMNHKLEDIKEYIVKHSKGKPYGKMGFETDSLYDYVAKLSDEYGFQLHKFFLDYVPRLQFIRLYANCLKHRGGFPSETDDAKLLQLLNRAPGDVSRITRTVEEFISDSVYAVLSVRFFFRFIHRIHDVFFMVSEQPGGAQLTNRQQAMVQKLVIMCAKIKDTPNDDSYFKRMIGDK